MIPSVALATEPSADAHLNQRFSIVRADKPSCKPRD
jgi:hypothetical protein